ncbi:phage head morphogenesis protein, SPP1 gp7 family [Bacteroidales bacterium Barb6XT]|nr:phage head morphogenesis protein, SPP1 gp7 family [Bacteroidales bacterium Barb6XT]
MTKEDSHVRAAHRLLQGIILPVDDPFRNSYYPPNGWRCRCSTRKLTQRMYDSRVKVYEQKGTSDLTDSEMSQKRAGEVVAKPFRRNVGTSEIFDRNGHPYFKANRDAREMQLSAVKNYGMKLVKDICDSKISLSKYRGGIKSPEEFRQQWEAWEKQYEKPGEGFTIVDKKNNISSFFDRSLMEKTIRRKRYGYFDEIERIINDPDEIWATWQPSGRMKNEFFNIYARYYEDTPVAMLINNDGRVDSLYKWDGKPEDFEKFRTGLLKKRKR